MTSRPAATRSKSRRHGSSSAASSSRSRVLFQSVVSVTSFRSDVPTSSISQSSAPPVSSPLIDHSSPPAPALPPDLTIQNPHVLFLNINATIIRDKLNSLKATLLSEPFASSPPLLIALAEAEWPATRDQYANIYGYTLEHKLSSANASFGLTGTSHGGLATYVHSSAFYERRHDLEAISAPPGPQASLPIMWLHVSSSHQLLLCGVVYRNPSSSPALLTALQNNIQAVTALGVAPVLILGDFNLHHTSWHDTHPDPSRLGTQFADFCTDNDLTILNTTLAPGAPTRQPSAVSPHPSIIDLAITDSPTLVTHMQIPTSLPLLTDHYPLVLQLSLPPSPALGAASPSPRRFLKPSECVTFSSNASQPLALWHAAHCHLLADAHVPADAQDRIDTLSDDLNSILLAAVPPAPARPPRSHALKSLSPTIAALVTKVKHINGRLRRHPDDEDTKRALLAAKQAVADAVRDHGRERIIKLLPSAINENGTLNYSRYHSLTRRSSYFAPMAKNPDGSLPSSTLQSVTNIGRHFASTCTTTPAAADDSIASENATAVDKELPGLLASSGELDRLAFPAADVKRAISRLKTTSAGGPDNVSAAMLRSLPPSGFDALSLLFTLSWRWSVLPHSWRAADVKALYKRKGNHTDPGNYRPISLTSHICKTMERLILPPLRALAERTHPFLPLQFGFRSSRSTLHAILRLHSVTSRFTSAAHNNPLHLPGHLNVAFLDIAKAFDSVWRDGIVYKLANRFGVTGCALRWISQFLSHRQLRVFEGGDFSDWFDYVAGVPQGSVLSPFLFLCFIDDCADDFLDLHVSPILFADDLGLHSHPLDPLADQHLQAALDALSRWSRKWRLVFSAAKSEYVCFSSGSNPSFTPPHQAPRLNGQQLKRSETFKYLGVVFDAHGSWAPHADYAIAKTKTAVAMLSSVFSRRAMLPPPLALTLFNAAVRPVLSYGWPVWVPPTARHWDLILSLYASFLRRAFCLPTSTDRISLITDLNQLLPRSSFDLELLRLGQRLLKSDEDHPLHINWPTAASLNTWSFAALHSTPPLPVLLHECCTYFRIPTASLLQLSGKFLKQRLLLWDKATAYWLERNTQLSAVSSPLCPTPRFLFLLPSSVFWLLQRLRQNRSTFNARLASMYKDVSPVCDHPPCQQLQLHETVQHALLNCPRFVSARAACFASLRECSAARLKLDLSVLVGTPSLLSVCTCVDSVSPTLPVSLSPLPSSATAHACSRHGFSTALPHPPLLEYSSPACFSVSAPPSLPKLSPGSVNHQALTPFFSHKEASHGVFIFTDGSALANPGPSGSGVFLLLPAYDKRGQQCHIAAHLALSLGRGTNNIAELCALSFALDIVSLLRSSIDFESGRSSPAERILPSNYILATPSFFVIGSDSQLALDTARSAVTSSFNPLLATAIQMKYDSLISDTTSPLHLVKIKAHDDSWHNHVADILAGVGAHLVSSASSTRGHAPTPLFPIDVADPATQHQRRYGPSSFPVPKDITRQSLPLLPFVSSLHTTASVLQHALKSCLPASFLTPQAPGTISVHDFCSCCLSPGHTAPQCPHQSLRAHPPLPKEAPSLTAALSSFLKSIIDSRFSS